MHKFILSAAIVALLSGAAFAQDEALQDAVAAAQEQALAEIEEEQVQHKIEMAGKFRQDVQKVVVIKDEYPFNMESYARYMPKSDVSAQDGSVGIIDSSAQWSYEIKLFERLPVEFNVQQDYININNSTRVKVPSRLTGISFGLETTLPLVMTKNLYFRLGISPSFYTDNWSMYENALRFNQRYFAIWQPSDKFTAILGMAVQPRYRNVFLPIAGVIYKPNGKWLFNIVPTRPTISYFVNDKLSVYAEYGFSGGEYVVTKDDIKGTVLEYDEQHAGIGLKYTINKYIQASLGGGGTFGRKLRYRESYGKIVIDNGLYGEFRFDVRI